MKKITFLILMVSVTFFYACQGKEKADQKQVEKNNDLTEKKSASVEKAVITLTKEDFKEKVMDYEKHKEWNYKGDLPCIIDFYADWCAPCRIAGPILEEIAQEYKGKVNVYKVDTQKDPELAQIFGVQGIPAFLYCPKAGKPSMTSGIGRTNEQTKEMFRNAIESILLKE